MIFRFRRQDLRLQPVDSLLSMRLVAESRVSPYVAEPLRRHVRQVISGSPEAMLRESRVTVYYRHQRLDRWVQWRPPLAAEWRHKDYGVQLRMLSEQRKFQLFWSFFSSQIHVSWGEQVNDDPQRPLCIRIAVDCG